MAFQSRNPATGELIASFDTLSPPEIEDRLARAAAAFRQWKIAPPEERSRLLTRIADRLEADRDALSRTITTEMGKPLRDAEAEVLKCARACRYYAEHGAAFLAEEDAATEASRSYVRYEPMGAIVAIMPWNFPFWQLFRFAAPALLAGNVVLLKHAPNVPQCALAIDAVLRQAGAPEGVFQSLFLEVDDVARLLDDDRVAGVTLTGSDRAGRDVASRAGRALKKSVLELGGSDPFIVMPSADLALAVATAVKSRTLNTGQSCIAAKRFIVDASIAEPFCEQFVAKMGALSVGDPLDPATDIGPMARADLVDALAAQVADAVERGARVLLGGKPLDRRGFYYPPSVLTDVPVDSRPYREEVFGPVASVFVVRGVDEAIRLANDTRYGLGSSVWTTDRAERDRFVAEIEAGQVFVNAMVASDPRVPFGGVKTSGYGRELGPHGLREFTQAKTVWVA